MQLGADSINHQRVASELVRAVRGRRSCAELSRRMGYRSNIVHRWETGQCWPSASRFLALQQQRSARTGSWIERFFNMSPRWADGLDPVSPPAVAAFLQHLKGKTSVVRIAELSGRNRYSVARWIDGSTEPKLPDFLCLVDACSRRLVDLVAALVDPAVVPCLQERWQQEQLARKAAYELPWSHAVLRALELADCPSGVTAQRAFIARKLGISSDKVREALTVLEATSQIKKQRGRFVPREVMAIDTSRDPKGARELKVAWTATALDRLTSGADGRYGYSLFAVSRADLARLHDLHLQYVRAMQEVIASSKPSECVGLYCAQLLDLGAGVQGPTRRTW